MISSIRICNAYELDIEHNHTLHFLTPQYRNQYFNSKTIHLLDEQNYQKKDENTIWVGKSLNDLKYANYLIYTNEDSTYYYFIVDKIYDSEGATVLYLKLDVIQTYLFDINFFDCLIEREHTHRWRIDKPVYHYEDENLDTGEYVLKKRTEVFNYNHNTDNGCYVIVSSDRLGTSTETRPGETEETTPGATTPGGENFKNGYLDENGIRLIKSFEGFRAEPYNIGDGTNTVGYGVTEVWNVTYYNQLIPSCTESQASIVLGVLCHQSFSSQVKTLCDSELGETWLNQNRLNALSSYMWQWGNLADGGLWDILINNKDDEQAIYQAYKNLGNVSGYASRREREANAFVGVYDEMLIGTGDSTNPYVTENDGKGYIPQEYQ